MRHSWSETLIDWATSDAETTPHFFMAFITFFFMAGAAGAAAFFVAAGAAGAAILVCFKQRQWHSWHTPSRHILLLQPPISAFLLSRMSCCCFCKERHCCSSRSGNVQSSSKTGLSTASPSSAAFAYLRIPSNLAENSGQCTLSQ